MSVQLQTAGPTLYTQSGFSVNAQGPHTIIGWLNANSGTWSTNTRSMIGLYSSSNINGGAGCASQIGARAGNANVVVWDWGAIILVQSTGFTPVVGTFFHVAFTYDGTTARLYINGVLNNSAVVAKLTGTFNMVFVNGYIFGGTAESSPFIVDGLMAFQRALTANEIMSIYSTGGERDGITNDSIARFPLDGRSAGQFVTASADDSIFNQNLLPQQNGAVAQPGGAGWTTGTTTTVVSTTVAAPDLSTTAANITFSSASNTTSREFLAVLTTTAATSYTGMFYVQNNGSTGQIQLIIGNTGQTILASAVLNLVDGTIASTSSAGAVTGVTVEARVPRGGWYTIFLTATFTNATAIGISVNGQTGSASANFNAWNMQIYPTANMALYETSSVVNSNERIAQI